MYQFVTSTDLTGIIPEIILTITALSVLSLDMMRLLRASVSLTVASLGLVIAGFVVIQGNMNTGVLFGGMLKLDQFSIYFDVCFVAYSDGVFTSGTTQI